MVGKLVGTAIKQALDLAELPLATLQAESGLIAEDIYQVLTLEGSVNARNHLGGTAPDQVRAAVARAIARLDALAG